MENEKTLLEMLIEAGYPKEDVFHHESDLYVYVSNLTTRVIEEWCEAQGYDIKLVKEESFLFGKFRDQITGRMMYDIAFQYTPFWEERKNEA